jgi:hypothetical protein
MGLSAIGIPTFGLYFRRYAPFDTFGVPSFEGDKRKAASTSLKATSRTYGCVMFNQFEIVHRFANTSGTHYHSSLWGEIVGASKVSMTNVRTSLAGPSLIEFSASTAGGNPLIPKSPDIDTFVTARFDFGSPKLLRIGGEVFGDNFPNLEVFLMCYRSSHTALLIDGRTTGGRRTGPMTRLAGAHSKQSLGKLSGTLLLNDAGEMSRDYTTGATTI